MNEPEFLNLEVGSVVYRKGSSMPCVIAATKPHVVAVVAVTIPMEDASNWERSMAKVEEPEPPKDVFQVVVSLLKVSPDGGVVQIGDGCTVGPDFIDAGLGDSALKGAVAILNGQLTQQTT